MQEEERLLESEGDWSLNNRAMDPEPDLGLFRVWLCLSQGLGLLCLVLVGSWCSVYLGGFAWQDNPKLQFNHHPLFMVLGFVFCYGNALLVYRAFRDQRKSILKLAHLALHSLALLFAGVGLKAVFDSHNLASPHPIPNLYSLHSWMGLATVLLFAAQYVCGVSAFLLPGARRVWRARYLPLHVFFGAALFGLAIAAACTGITEKLIFHLGGAYSGLPPAAVLGNVLGVCLVCFGLTVLYLLATPQFRRQTPPEEQQLQLEQQQE